MCSQILVFIIWPVLGGTGLVAGQRSRRWDFMAKAERYGPLVKERGLAAVQKQRGYRMSTGSNREERLHREKKQYMKSVKKKPKWKILTEKQKKQRKCVRHT